MMTMIPIAAQVDPQAARAFASVTPEMRRKLETLPSGAAIMAQRGLLLHEQHIR